ncbi:MAG: kinase-like domain-containing protein [Benjaminiella poitrasii]|nr:MAG: kinase-like domain-containing protein [Benjaminiella poitrasii]
MTTVDTMVSPTPQRKVFGKFSNKKQKSPMSSPGNRRRKEVGDYWLGKTLGRGSSGRVKIGIHKVTGEKVAIKIIPKSHLAANASVEKAVKREIAVMKLINHPNIMSLLDVIDLSDSPNLYLILEYVQGGELFEHLVSKGRLSEPEARKYFQQIIVGLDYCHRHLICHRDLKPENLLLDQSKNIKIADFGMASLQPTGQMLETSCGSPHYASPEIVNGVPYDGSASDIWSCGIILFALLSGHLPFDDDNIRQLLNKVKIGKYRMPDHLSAEAKDLIANILVVDPAKRLTMKQLQSHPWFTFDPPPNITTLPDPPTAAEIGKPVEHESEIDDRILKTLKVLWTDLSTEKVVEALLNPEYNMQKVTYVLLQRHATSYWQTERDDDLRSVTSPAKRRRPATICAVPARKELYPGLDSMMSKLVECDKTPKSPQLTPGIQHRASPSPLLSHNPRDTTLNSVVSPMDIDDLPPPLPPKSDTIRSDQATDIQNQWTFTPIIQRRRSLWRSPILARPTTNKFFSGALDTSLSNRNSYMSANNQQFALPPPQVLNTAYDTQPHVYTNQLLSPKVSSSHQQGYQPTIKTPLQQQQRKQPYQFPSFQQQDSKLNKFMNIWQRNHRVDPNIPFQNGAHPFRFSLPQQPRQSPFDRKTAESSSSIWKENTTRNSLVLPHPSNYDQQQTPLLSAAGQSYNQKYSPSVIEPPLVESPKLTSWLPGLFHFKQPKVCSLECEARDEREAIGKISQVLKEYMEGSIVERQDPDGRIRRKGEMKLPHHIKPILLRFKLEIYQLQTTQRKRIYRINFIQQQGDAMALAAAVKLLDQTLQTYEQEAELVATANGWNIRNSLAL